MAIFVTGLLVSGCSSGDNDRSSDPTSSAMDSENVDVHQGGDTRVVCEFDRSTLNEVSGMTASIRHAGILWVHNDSGDGSRIYALGAADCKIKATITLGGVSARDIEAIAVGRNASGDPVLWVGDIGDNQSSWPNVRLYRIPEPKQLESQTIDAQSFAVTYEGGPTDAEGLLVDPKPNGGMWIVGKKMAASSSIYALPENFVSQGSGQALKIGAAPAMASDAAFAPDGRSYVIRTYLSAETFSGIPMGESQGRVSLPIQFQGEAITYNWSGLGLYVASEGSPELYFVPL